MASAQRCARAGLRACATPPQILDTLRLPWAKTICVEECPGAESYCDLDNHTSALCNTDAQFRCPYYMGAEAGLYGTLPDLTDPRDTQYFEALANTTKTTCDISSDAFGEASSAINAALSAANAVTDTCGQLYQVRKPTGQAERRPPELPPGPVLALGSNLSQILYA